MATQPLPLNYRVGAAGNLSPGQVDSNFSQLATGLAALTDTVGAIAGGPGSGVTQFVQLTDKSSADIPNINVPVSNALASKLPTTHAGTGGTAHANAVASGAAGFMTGSDKAKLDSLSTTPGATSFTALTDAGTADIPAINSPTANALAGKLATAHAGTGGAAHAPVVAGGAAGFMTGADKTKLDSMVSGPPGSGATMYIDLTDKVTADLPGLNTPLSTALAGKLGIAHAGVGGIVHANAVPAGAAGFMTGADKAKLDGVAAGATANVSDATLLARSNHTGTQIATTISDFVESSQDVIGAMIAAAGGSYNDAAGTIALPVGGGAPVGIAYATVVPLDNAGSGKDMGSHVLTAADNFTIATSPAPILNGACLVEVQLGGGFMPTFGPGISVQGDPFTVENGRVYEIGFVQRPAGALAFVTKTSFAADVVAPVLGTPHVENGTASVIQVPITELNSPALNGTTAGITLSGTGVGGRTVSSVAVAASVLNITLSAPILWSDSISVAIAAGMVRDASANLSIAKSATAVVNNLTIPVPNPPTAVTAGVAGLTTMPLSWTAGIVDASHGPAVTYTAEVSAHLASTWFPATPTSTTSATISGLTAGTSYDFRVKATNASGDSIYSTQLNNVFTATPSTGSLSVAKISSPGGADMNLTTFGTIDWFNMPLLADGTFDDYKSGGGQVIRSSMTLTNAVRTNGASAGHVVSWTDGTWTAVNASAPSTAIFSPSTAGAISYVDFSIPAGVGIKKARIVVNTYTGGRTGSVPLAVRFHLSDTASPDVNQTFDIDSGGYGTVQTILEASYNSASAGQTLRIRVENTTGAPPGDEIWMGIQAVTYGT